MATPLRLAFSISALICCSARRSAHSRSSAARGGAVSKAKQSAVSSGERMHAAPKYSPPCSAVKSATTSAALQATHVGRQ